MWVFAWELRKNEHKNVVLNLFWLFKHISDTFPIWFYIKVGFNIFPSTENQNIINIDGSLKMLSITSMMPQFYNEK